MGESKSDIVVYRGPDQGGLAARSEPVTARNAPAIVKAAGRSAEFAWEEFFQGEIANAHTRRNYLLAVRKFLAWVEVRGIELPRITPATSAQDGPHLLSIIFIYVNNKNFRGRMRCKIRSSG